MSWLLLEYEKEIRESAGVQLAAAGIEFDFVYREDQLQGIQPGGISLVLIGEGWQPQTVQKLRSIGVFCNFVFVAKELTREKGEIAKKLSCVDIVSYPLSVPYLRRWAMQAQENHETEKATQDLTPMQKILQKRNILSRKQTYTGGINLPESDSSAPVMVKGKIVLVCSVRGGVGKSVVTSLVAKMLAKRNYKVAVVDLDPNGNIIALNHEQTSITVDEWVKLPSHMDERMIKQSLIQSKAGFWILPSGRNTGEVDDISVRKILYNLASCFDVVLVDTTAAQKSTEYARDLSHHALFIMTPEWMSFKWYVEGFHELRSFKGDDGVTLVVNRLRKLKEHERALRLLDQEEGIPPFEEIDEDRVLYNQIMRGENITGSKNTVQAVQSIIRGIGFDPVVEESRKVRRWRFGLR